MSVGIECYRGVVHPWLCDMMGHMTTRHYTAMFDDGSYHLLAAIGYCPQMLAGGIGFADVKLTTSFKAELNAGALVIIHGSVAAVGGKSLTTFYRMANLNTGEVAAELESVTVQFDLKMRRAIALLPEIRAGALANLQGREVARPS